MSNYILTKYTLTFEGFQLANHLDLIPSDFVRRLLLLNSDRCEVTYHDRLFCVEKPISRNKPKYFEDFEKDQLDIIADCETDEVIGRFLKPVYCQFRFFIDSGDGSEFAIETHSYKRIEANWTVDE